MSFAEFSGSIPQHYDECLAACHVRALRGRPRRPPAHERRDARAGAGVRHGRRDAAPARRAARVGDARRDRSERGDGLRTRARPCRRPGSNGRPPTRRRCRSPTSRSMPSSASSGSCSCPTRALGFAEAHRVLVPGGAMHANAWLALDSNPVNASIDEAVAALFPDDPPRFLDVPYGYHDRARILSDATAGGFADVRLEEVRVQAQGPIGTRLRDGLRARHAAQSRSDPPWRRPRRGCAPGRRTRRRPPWCRSRDGRPRRDGDHRHARPLTRSEEADRSRCSSRPDSAGTRPVTTSSGAPP